jgi:uncharacterized protein YjbI with pentapeptide repeats
MTHEEHLQILKQGASAWNTWRAQHRQERIRLNGEDLRGRELRGVDLNEAELIMTDLREVNLREANLSRAILIGAKLNGACLREADLSEANLSQAVLIGANLIMARLRAADLSLANLNAANLGWAVLSAANLRKTELSGADLTHIILTEAILIRTNLQEAKLHDCRIYGISTWDLDLTGAKQAGLIITPHGEPTITVDNLEVAQFIYLLLHNEKIRNIIDTIGEKGVLILGRFTEERKAVLDAIRERLRALGFVPMMFDFERPTQRDFTETIKTLAGMSRFIVADITNPKSSPLELQATMPDYMIPFVPIIHEDEEPFAMFQDLKQKYGAWVLDVLKYDSTDSLLQVFDKAVVRPALEMSQTLLLKKAKAIRDRHVKDYM